MQLFGNCVVSSLICAASASKVGHVYVYDPAPNASLQPPSSVTPVTARLIVAQRLGLSQFHSIKHANKEAIQQLNAYGGRQQTIFGGEYKERSKAVLIWVEDVEDVSAIIKYESAYSAAFTVLDPPSMATSDRLMQDLILQTLDLPKRVELTYTVGVKAEQLLKVSKDIKMHNNYLHIFRASKADKLDFSMLSSSLAQLLADSTADKNRGFSITVVLMPPSSSDHSTYDLPSAV